MKKMLEFLCLQVLIPLTIYLIFSVMTYRAGYREGYRWGYAQAVADNESSSFRVMSLQEEKTNGNLLLRYLPRL